MHGLPIGVLCAILSATRIWTASSLESVHPDSVPPAGAEPEIRLYAARGEYESFQICIRSPHRQIDGVNVAPESMRAGIGPPEVRRVGYLAVEEPSSRAFSERAVHPDPLLPFEPFLLEQDTTGVLWATYYVPPDCPAGIYEGRIGIRLGERAKRYVTVTLEVFDFEIPATPGITAAMELDPEILRDFLGLPDYALETWRSFYDALAPWRLAYNVALPLPLDAGDPDLYVSHVLYAAARAQMPAILLGRGERLANRLNLNAPQGAQLHTVAEALKNQGWGRRAYAEPLPPLPRSHWNETRQSYSRFGEIVPSVRRLIRGVPHPELQEIAEIWVLPMRFFDPIAVQRVRSGLALAAKPAFPLESARASSSARIPTPDMPYAAVPADAYDGSLYTAWTSDAPPAPGAPQWLELHLHEPAATEAIRVGWRSGHEALDPRVRISRDGTEWNTVQIRWAHYLPDTPYDQSWSEGQFGRIQTFTGIRFEFTASMTGASVSITEIELGRAPDPATIAYLSGGARVWIEQASLSFPALYADAHPLEARLLPWLCWGHGLDGSFGQTLNRWPEAWKHLDTPTPEIWPAPDAGKRFLVYPAPGSLAPSCRLARLRDGIEDFEYIRAALEAGIHDKVIGPGTMRLCRWEHYDAETDSETLDGATAELEQLRVTIGRALTRAARED